MCSEPPPQGITSDAGQASPRLEEGAYLPQHAWELFAGPWLVFAPHPDDETFGMGGAIALARQRGLEVHVVVVTDGALGGEGCDLAARREQEVLDACERLGGASVAFWREPDRGLFPSAELIEKAAERIRALPGGTCFFPGLLEPHPDHRACALIAWAGLRRAGFVMEAVAYEISVQNPCNRLIDITQVVALKQAAMRAHASQACEHPYERRVLAMNVARAWSLPQAVTHAEAFFAFPPTDATLEAMLADLQITHRLGLRELPAIRGTLPAGGATILFVLASTVVGGAEIQTFNLLNGLLRDGARVVLQTHQSLAPLFSPLVIAHPQTFKQVFFEERGLHEPFDYSPRNCLAYAMAIADAARREDAALVHGVMHNASIFVALGRWRHYRSLRGRRLSGSLHGSLLGYFAQRGRPASRVERLLLSYTLHALDGVVTPSQGVAHELLEQFGARVERVRAVYNGFDLQGISRRAHAGVAPAKQGPWILTSCRLTDQKDFRTLIEAFALLSSTPAATLVILGEGPLEPQIRAWIDAFGVTDRVLLPGFQDNPFPWMLAADVFVLSSFYEGFGNVLVEAMALGVPVVATDCPWGPAEIVTHEESGLVVPAGDTVRLAASLQRCLDDSGERARLGRGAAMRARAFSLDAMCAGYDAYFAAVLEGQR